MAERQDLRRTGWQEKHCRIFYKWCVLGVGGTGKGKRKHLWAFDISFTPSPIFKSKTNKTFMWNLNMTVSLTMKAKAHPVAFSPGVSLWWIWPYGIAKQKSILHWELFWNSNAKKQESEQFSPFPSPSLTPKVTQEIGTKHNLRHVKHKVCPMFQKKKKKTLQRKIFKDEEGFPIICF